MAYFIFMDKTLIDNTEHRMMVDTLKSCINESEFNEIMIATGFWDLPGMKLVVNELEHFLSREGTSVRLLIGSDPIVKRNYLDKKFPDEAIKDNIFKLQFNEDYKHVIDLLFKYCKVNSADAKFKIRIYKRDEDGSAQFLHSKCYIFTNTNQDKAIGIIGSSNFTKKGLEGNAELNYVETDARIVNYKPTQSSNLLGHTQWFNQMWQQSEEWNGEFIKDILSKAPIAKDNPNNPDNQQPAILTPYEIYIKYLQLQFGDMVDASTTEVLKSYLPPSFNPLEYQLDAVKQCFSIMKRYGGFLLGDVVGLGKTIVGVLIIRHFIENAESLGRQPKVLIITPPAIKKNWIKTIKDFDINSLNQIESYVTFVTSGSVGKISEELEYIDDLDEGDEIVINANDYGLILIDESHNFRNSETQKYKAVDELIGSITPTPYVALLSATPQNNSPKDIYNQIRLFQRQANNSSLPNIKGGKLDSFFNRMEMRFKMARSVPQDTEEGRLKARQIIAEVSDEIRKCVLNELVVRRTRTDIKSLYGADAELLKFPTVKGPHKLEYKMDDELQMLFYETVNAICPPLPTELFDDNKHIGFYRYAAITQFLKEEHRKLYEKRNLTVAGITHRLKKIMQILLVKRLESSIVAFCTTLKNLLSYTETMIEMLNNNRVYICPDIDVNKVYKDADSDFDAFRAEMDKLIGIKGGNNRCFLASDFNPTYLTDLRRDEFLIKKLLDKWNRNSYDPKFDRFKESLNSELFAPDINNPSGKNKPRLVIFTEAIDTLEDISRFLKAKGYKVLKVSSKNRTELQDDIEKNFDANCQKQCDEYNVIVTTEVLAEGVNLHRANVILNYDAPWNATRLMQRIGRVNRIGSVEEFVHVFNFFPSEEGNSQIRLIEKAYAKLQSFHEMFGEDNKVFSEREELCEHDLQVMIDGDESPFTPFINEFKEYQAKNKIRYNFIMSVKPEKLGGMVSSTEHNDSIFVFTDDSHGYISVQVENSDKDSTETAILSSLDTMKRLKCIPTDTFECVDLLDKELADAAKKAYQRHVDHYLTQRDSSKKQNNALKVIKELRSIENLSDKSKKLLKEVEQLVRNKDNDIIRILLKYNPEQLSFFGIEGDINDMIQESFANISRRVMKKRGDLSLVLYKIN